MGRGLTYSPEAVLLTEEESHESIDKKKRSPDLTGSDRIGPKIGLVLCFNRFFLNKNDLYERIMYLVPFVCI